MKRLLWLAAFLALPAVSHGQVVIGTDPDVPANRVVFGGEGSGTTQTFVARGQYLRRLSFWFHGGTTVVPAMYYFSKFWLDKGPFTEEHVLFNTYLDQEVSGRVDMVFADPLAVIDGEIYSFTLWTNNGSTAGEDEYCLYCTPIGETFRYPQVEMTAIDAYVDGFSSNAYTRGQYRRSGDIRFEAEFLVPEPHALGMLAVGFFGVLFRRRRVRRRGHTENGAARPFHPYR